MPLGSRLFRLLLAGWLCGLPAATAVAETIRPVVAVFGIEDRTGRLDPPVIQQLSDYLRARMAAGGAFQIVPGSQIKERLVEQRKESYKDCYDQQCQIDIGREVAAQKSLATQIVAVGSTCALITTLYDLKRATSDGSATEKSACSQDELVGSLERAVATLTRQLRERRAGSRPVRAGHGTLRLDGLPPGAEVLVDGVFRGQGPLRAALELAPGEHLIRVRAAGHRPWEKKVIAFPDLALRERVALQAVATIVFETSPPGALLGLDGEARGRTPLSLELDVGRRHALRLERAGYDPIAEELTVRKPARRGYALTVPRWRRLGRNDVFAMEGLGGVRIGGRPGDGGMGLVLMRGALCWPHLVWTILEGGIGVTSSSTRPLWLFGDTHLALVLHFGRRDEHQLRLGLGFGWGGGPPIGTDAGSTDPGEFFLFVTPTIQYLYQTSGRLFLGVGLRAFNPVSPNIGPASQESGYPPTAILVSLPIGWATRL